MATLWAFQSGLSQTNTGTALFISLPSNLHPALGDLVVCTVRMRAGAGAYASLTLADSSPPGNVGGAWQPMIPTGPIINGSLITMGWWKIANQADVFASVNMIVTASGGTGSGGSMQIECDVYRLPAGNAVVASDIAGNVSSASTVSTLTWSPSAGSAYPAFADALVLSCMVNGSTSTFGARTGTNTFTGTSAAANLAQALATNAGFLCNQFAPGQASATAGTNVWVNTWTTARGSPVAFGMAFVYSSTGLLPAQIALQFQSGASMTVALPAGGAVAATFAAGATVSPAVAPSAVAIGFAAGGGAAVPLPPVAGTVAATFAAGAPTGVGVVGQAPPQSVTIVLPGAPALVSVAQAPTAAVVVTGAAVPAVPVTLGAAAGVTVQGAIAPARARAAPARS